MGKWMDEKTLPHALMQPVLLPMTVKKANAAHAATEIADPETIENPAPIVIPVTIVRRLEMMAKKQNGTNEAIVRKEMIETIGTTAKNALTEMPEGDEIVATDPTEGIADAVTFPLTLRKPLPQQNQPMPAPHLWRPVAP
jgi:hypothetical protein